MLLSFSGWSTFDWPDITRALLDSVGGSFTSVTVDGHRDAVPGVGRVCARKGRVRGRNGDGVGLFSLVVQLHPWSHLYLSRVS